MYNILITGGCGFLGSNLAAYGIENNNNITIFDNLSRLGSYDNYQWLKTEGDFKFIHGDIRNKNDVESIIKNNEFDAIFHLSGQVAMTTSIENPYKDFETNVLGTLNILDSVRKYSSNTHIFYSSTNKVYGDLEEFNYVEENTRYVCKEYPNGFPETVNLNFHSPYGCSKGSADQYMLDYNRIFGIKTTVFRHSSMYGSRQFSTYDQGWIGWFCQKALETKNNRNTIFTISGNGKQVRDILHASDMINLYYSALNNSDRVSGKIYNIGGGMEQSLSLLELFSLLNDMLNIKLRYEQLPFRISDQKVFVADISKINKDINWKPEITSYNGISEMILWLGSNNEY